MFASPATAATTAASSKPRCVPQATALAALTQHPREAAQQRHQCRQRQQQAEAWDAGEAGPSDVPQRMTTQAAAGQPAANGAAAAAASADPGAAAAAVKKEVSPVPPDGAKAAAAAAAAGGGSRGGTPAADGGKSASPGAAARGTPEAAAADVPPSKEDEEQRRLEDEILAEGQAIAGVRALLAKAFRWGGSGGASLAGLLHAARLCHVPFLHCRTARLPSSAAPVALGWHGVRANALPPTPLSMSLQPTGGGASSAAGPLVLPAAGDGLDGQRHGTGGCRCPRL